jgi:glycosyltransferase involved in cell wall biosynthesis
MTVQPKRLEIVQISPFYPPHLGGMENVTKCLAEQLSFRHDVRVLTTDCGSRDAPKSEEDGLLTVRRHAGVCVAHTPISPGLAYRIFRVNPSAIVHAHVAGAFVPDVILLAAIVRQLRYIAHFHLDVQPSGKLGALLGLHKRWVLGPFLRRAQSVIVLSSAQAAFVAERYGVPADRIAVIPNGVDDRFFSLGTSRDPATRRTGATRLLFVGRLDVQKNVGRLVSAMASVSANTELVIVGDGEQRSLIKDQIDHLGLPNVRLVGAQRGDELLRWYEWADIFVLPSNEEGMPLVLLEATAARLPIIATDVPGIRELVADVAYLAEPTATALACAIDEVATSSGLLAQLAEASANRAVKFRWSASIAAIERIYERVAAC